MLKGNRICRKGNEHGSEGLWKVSAPSMKKNQNRDRRGTQAQQQIKENTQYWTEQQSLAHRASVSECSSGVRDHKAAETTHSTTHRLLCTGLYLPGYLISDPSFTPACYRLKVCVPCALRRLTSFSLRKYTTAHPTSGQKMGTSNVRYVAGTYRAH